MVPASSRRAASLLLASIAGYLVMRWLTAPTSIDLAVYRAEGAAVRAGLDLYGPLPTPRGLKATYPPFAALLFVPLSFASLFAAQIWVLALNLALVVAIGLLSCRLAGVAEDRRLPIALTVAAAAIWAEPVFTTLRYGQINLLLLVLVMWDFTRPRSARWRGIAIGIATGIKITPGIFVVYLLLTRRFREAAVATVSFVVTVGVAALVLPHATWRYWTNLLFDVSRVGRLDNAANQSIKGLAVRLVHTREAGVIWTVVIAAVGLAGLACAVLAHRRLGDRWGLLACAVTGLLVGPIEWTHHWVWCVPIAVLLWQHARQWLPAAAVFWSFAVWAVPHAGSELHFALWQVALSGWYVLFGAGFLVLTAVTAWRAPRHGLPDEQDITRAHPDFPITAAHRVDPPLAEADMRWTRLTLSTVVRPGSAGL